MTRRYLVRSGAAHPERALPDPTRTLSETVLRAAHPSVHRRRSRRLNAAARNATSQAGRIIKQTRALCASSRPPRPTSDVRSVLFAARLSPCEIKLCQKDEKFIPHFRRTALFSSGGGVPKGRRGNNTPMSGDYTLTHRRGLNLTPMIEGMTLSRRKEGEF